MSATRMIILMGVAGTGKTSIGQRLAKDLGWAFEDADDYHSDQSKAKMRRGEPLEDEDRFPWLQSLNIALTTWRKKRQPTVLACSALKATYRQQLTPPGSPEINWVYLQGDFQTIQSRLWKRQQSEPEHFMAPELLKSQFDALEEPEDAMWVSIEQKPEAIVAEIRRSLGL